MKRRVPPRAGWSPTLPRTGALSGSPWGCKGLLQQPASAPLTMKAQLVKLNVHFSDAGRGEARPPGAQRPPLCACAFYNNTSSRCLRHGGEDRPEVHQINPLRPLPPCSTGDCPHAVLLLSWVLIIIIANIAVSRKVLSKRGSSREGWRSGGKR